MKHTVVALFDRPDGAQKAADALIRQGFERTAVHITHQPAEELVQPSVVIEGGTGLTGRLGTLLSNLFGVDEEPHRSQYEEALRRGATLLAIEVEDAPRANAACDVLTATGTSNIEDRLGKWRESGWRAAGPPTPTAATHAAPTPAGRCLRRARRACIRQPLCAATTISPMRSWRTIRSATRRTAAATTSTAPRTAMGTRWPTTRATRPPVGSDRGRRRERLAGAQRRHGVAEGQERCAPRVGTGQELSG